MSDTQAETRPLTPQDIAYAVATSRKVLEMATSIAVEVQQPLVDPDTNEPLVDPESGVPLQRNQLDVMCNLLHATVMATVTTGDLLAVLIDQNAMNAPGSRLTFPPGIQR